MQTFKEFLLKEDPLHAMNAMKQRMNQQQGSTAGKVANLAGRAAVDAVTGGVGSTVIDVANFVNSLMSKKKQVDASARIDQLISQFQGLKIPEGLIDIDENLFNSLSPQAFITIMQHTLADLRAMNGNYNEKTKHLFNLKAKMFAQEVFGNARSK